MMCRLRCRLLAALFLIGAGLVGTTHATSSAPPVPPEPGHTAIWYDAENPGTGWVLEMLRDDRAAAYWYGFDEAGQPSWRVGAGMLEGDSQAGFALAFDDLYTGSGAKFGDAFNPDDVVLERTGSSRIEFQDCASGQVSVTQNDTISDAPLDRLTRTMGAGCEPLNGTPGYPVRSYAGQSGTWYNPARDGEGITLQWLHRDEAALYWFTYDLEGNPFWLLGVGNAEDGAIEFPELYSAQRDDEGQVELTVWGSLSVTLDCNTGSMSWASVVEGYGAGSHDLSRLNTLASPTCPTVKPELTDLYDIEVLRLPNPENRDIQVRDIADDGTVLGVERLSMGDTLVVLEPDATEWQTLGGPSIDLTQAVILAANAGTAFASEDPQSQTSPQQPLAFAPDDGWEPLAGFDARRYALAGASMDGTVLVGRLDEEDRNDATAGRAWRWDAETGLQFLPGVFDVTFPDDHALAISNDGRVAVGYAGVGCLSTSAFYCAGKFGVRWVDDQPPAAMGDDEDRALASAERCNGDCSVVFGADTDGLPRGSARIGQPWVWTADGRFVAIEGLEYSEEEQQLPSSHNWADSSADGTIAVGNSQVNCICTPVPPPSGFIWTQATGHVSIPELLTSLESDDAPGETFDQVAVAMSTDGRRILSRSYSSAHGTFLLLLTPVNP